MKFNYNQSANKSGVYTITNRVNGRIYVGSAAEFKSRWSGHANSLKVGKHQNKFLQNDFNKCGSEAFVFDVVELVETGKKDRLNREQILLNQHYDHQQQCYNLQAKTHSSRDGTYNKKIIDRFTDKRCRSPSQEIITKRSEGLKKAFQDPALRAECSRRAKEVRWKGHSINVAVVHKHTGETTTIYGSLRQWRIDRSLSYKAFHQLVRRKIQSSNGWSLV